jgi:SMC interacting uncharacterized protein involved in chromosome segregation
VNKEIDPQDDDNVVVIEERDNRSRVYIIIAAILGIALGGLIGSSLTASKWESTYQALESRYQSLASDRQQLVTKVEEKVANVDNEVELKLQDAIEQQRIGQAELKKQFQAQIAELEKMNLSLEEQVEAQKNEIETLTRNNGQLNRQADMQATMFERSRELFHQEFKVQLALEELEEEKAQLEPKLAALKKECDAYLEGTSWEVRTDSCDRQDEANSRLSQVNQMIRVHKLDLKQMKALAEQLGL